MISFAPPGARVSRPGTRTASSAYQRKNSAAYATSRPRVGLGLAVLEGDQRRELVGALDHQLPRPPQHLRAPPRRRGRPAGRGVDGRGHGVERVRHAGVGDPRDDLPGRRVVHGERRARGGRPPRAPDEEARPAAEVPALVEVGPGAGGDAHDRLLSVWSSRSTRVGRPEGLAVAGVGGAQHGQGAGLVERAGVVLDEPAGRHRLGSRPRGGGPRASRGRPGRAGSPPRVQQRGDGVDGRPRQPDRCRPGRPGRRRRVATPSAPASSPSSGSRSAALNAITYGSRAPDPGAVRRVGQRADRVLQGVGRGGARRAEGVAAGQRGQHHPRRAPRGRRRPRRPAAGGRRPGARRAARTCPSARPCPRTPARSPAST